MTHTYFLVRGRIVAGRESLRKRFAMGSGAIAAVITPFKARQIGRGEGRGTVVARAVATDTRERIIP